MCVSLQRSTSRINTKDKSGNQQGKRPQKRVKETLDQRRYGLYLQDQILTTKTAARITAKSSLLQCPQQPQPHFHLIH